MLRFSLASSSQAASPQSLAPSPDMQFLDSLNPEQRDAVLHINGPLLILAGAGSGKTRVITSRIAYLVGDGHAQPHEVLAVTFTNKAAEEMRARVASLLGSEVSGMWVSTFHALCARLLRREAPRDRPVARLRDIRFVRSAVVVKQALKQLQIDDSFIQPRAALSRISSAKNRMEAPQAMADAAGGNHRDAQIAKVYTHYLNTLKESNALDFDDLLLKTVDLFEQSERVRSKYSQQFRYVMVDEYQDTNRPQYLLIPPPRRSAPQPLRRGRPGSIDLQVARRGSPEHPRFRGRISGKRPSSSSSETTDRRR